MSKFNVLTIEVVSKELEYISGKSKKSGNDFELYKQSAYMHLPNKAYPVEISFVVKKDQAYQVGLYAIDNDSYYVDGFKNIALNLVLKPVQRPESK